MDNELVNKAREFIGIKFKHRGRTRNGVDCAGLIVVSFKELGREVVDLKVYGREPHKDGLKRTVEMNNLVKIDFKDAEIGDIILMRFNIEPHHLGILGDYKFGGFSIIHSFGEVGEVVEHRLDKVWEKRILEVYRYNK